jgi:hypothetical protein
MTALMTVTAAAERRVSFRAESATGLVAALHDAPTPPPNALATTAAMGRRTIRLR